MAPTPLSLLSSYSIALSCIRCNLNYFRFNYSLLILITHFLGLLWHPFAKIVFLLLFLLWIFLYFSRDEPIFVYNHSVDDRFVLLTLLLLLFLPWLLLMLALMC
ncbi:PRA1 family protein F2 [Bienertia sinuspersici]